MKLRCLNNFILDYPFSSKIALKILPQVIVTSFKFTNWTPVHRLKGEKFEKETKLINSLKNQCKEVPTIIASKFTNACYIKGLDDLAKNDARRDMLDKGYTPASKEYNKAVKNAGKDGRESGASIAKMANGLGAGRMIGSSINRMINKR